MTVSERSKCPFRPGWATVPGVVPDTLLERQEPSDRARNSGENGEICPETPMPRIHRHNAASHRTGSEETASASPSSANDVRMFHSGRGQPKVKGAVTKASHSHVFGFGAVGFGSETVKSNVPASADRRLF